MTMNLLEIGKLKDVTITRIIQTMEDKAFTALMEMKRICKKYLTHQNIDQMDMIATVSIFIRHELVRI